MDKAQQIYLLVASSADKEPIPGRNTQGKTLALVGVKQDIKMFKQKFRMKKNDSILSSRECKQLLTKQFIVNWIKNKFQAAPKDVYLFYSGHGHEEKQNLGDWAIETVQKPFGDSLQLDYLIILWAQSGANSRGHLYIFMDSCHSAGWCHRISQIIGDLNISIFASCNKNQKAKDLEGGGLLTRCILAINEQSLEQEIQLLFHKDMNQTPHFINKMNKPALLTRQHIALLQKDIRNACKIIDNISSKTPQSQVKQSQHKKPEKQINLNKQNKMIHSFLQAAGVPQWDNIKHKQKIELKGKELYGIPHSILELNKVKELNLDNNNISELPQSISNLPLVKFYLRNNNLSELPQSFGMLMSLEELSLANNPKIGDRYHGAIPPCILNLKFLTQLSLFNTNLKNIDNIDQLINLKYVKLACNKIKSPLSPSICNLPKLQTLCIHDNNIRDLPQQIYKLSNLKRLCIYLNNIMKLPQSIGIVPKLSQLLLTINRQSDIRIISLTKNRIKNLTLVHICNQNLKDVDRNQRKEFQALCQKTGVKLRWVKQWPKS